MICKEAVLAFALREYESIGTKQEKQTTPIELGFYSFEVLSYGIFYITISTADLNVKQFCSRTDLTLQATN